ncbi:hypothetical protein FQZ97_903740 [compost metagenome]
MLSGGHGFVATRASVPTSIEAVPIETWVVEDTLAFPEARDRLIALGLNRRQAIILSELCSLTLLSGALFVLKGGRARQYAQVLVRINCETSGMIEIPMGLTSGTPLRNALSAMPHARRLGVLNADLSPLEVYGARLLDTYFEAALEGNNNPQPLVLTCLGGEMSLPLPDVVRHIAVIIDLDQPWDAGTQKLEEVDIESAPLMAPLRSRLLGRLPEIQPEYQDQVERALVKALSPAEAMAYA